MTENTASDDLQDQLPGISEQLEAIQKETEAATNAILCATEQNNELINVLRTLVDSQSDADAIIDKLNVCSQDIVEACSFQDITSQRLKIIETSLGFHGEERPGEDSLENGPQLEGKGLSQSDIDALLD